MLIEGYCDGLFQPLPVVSSGCLTTTSHSLYAKLSQPASGWSFIFTVQIHIGANDRNRINMFMKKAGSTIGLIPFIKVLYEGTRRKTQFEGHCCLVFFDSVKVCSQNDS